jgi:hypothetical protein
MFIFSFISAGSILVVTQSELLASVPCLLILLVHRQLRVKTEKGKAFDEDLK